MATSRLGLAFERPIAELEERLVKLEATADQSPEVREEIRRLRRETAELTKKIYGELLPWQVVQVARHQDPPEQPPTFLVFLAPWRETQLNAGQRLPRWPTAASWKISCSVCELGAS